MMAALDNIQVTRAETSKLNTMTLENVPFGKYYTDHMLEADFEDGKWTNIEIKPYQPLLLEPSLAALHYGQAIFEGVKAYKDGNGNAFIFRPYDNFQRMNSSALRMNMPTIPEFVFMEGMRLLVDLDRNWIPQSPDHSLYIRPFMFSTDSTIGVKPSDSYKFMIILSPTGPYYNTPMKIYVEEKYTRAAPGGVGFSKNAGNYGASMLPTALAKKAGYDQVLWTDAFEHKYVQEVGTMNIFFVTDRGVVTPSLEEGTILAGVTRDSALTLLKDMGLDVQEKRISVDDLMRMHREGHLLEVFGTGTAATISIVKELKYKDYHMHFGSEKGKVATELGKRLDDIRYGRTPDLWGWMVKV